MGAREEDNMQNAVTACAIAAAGIAMGSVAGDANAPLAPYACLAIPAALQESPPQSLDAEQRALAAHLSRRFFVAQSEAGRFVAVAYRAAQEVGLDPLLVLAVIAVESRFNPIAESVAGAKGLMQIIPKFHHAKLERDSPRGLADLLQHLLAQAHRGQHAGRIP